MVEVFRTNVEDAQDAQNLVEMIHLTFADYQANFDLEDCDRILRIKSNKVAVNPYLISYLLGGKGFHAEVLSEDVPTAVQVMLSDYRLYPVLE